MTVSVSIGGLFEPSPLGGVLGAHTASIFKLDPITATIPIEPLLDIVPGVTPMRVTLDCIDDERIVHEYKLTTHALQDVTDATSNVHRALRELTITGTMSSFLPPPPIPVSLPAPPNPLGLIRIDLIRVQNIQRMADNRQPVMVVTPRYALARAFIARIERVWKPDDGEVTNVTLVFREANIVAPSVGAPSASDYKAQLPGNNAAQGGGQAANATSTTTATPSATPGVPPHIG